MKIQLPAILLLAFCSASFPTVVRASGVDEATVPADIEWFVHVDADLLRSTESGSLLITELKALSPAANNPQMPVDPVLIINGLRGLTAFGSLPDLETGATDVDAVVVIEGTEELLQVFRGLIAGLKLEQPDLVTELQAGDMTILQLVEYGFSGVFLDETRIAVGKSMSSISEFLDVYSGKTAHVSLGSRFPTYRLGAESGIFLGAFVEGIDGFQNLPAQARILQLTHAVAVQLGEQQDYLSLLVSLSTDSPTTARQVSEVLKGLIALSMMTQTGQPDIAELIESARVSLDDNLVGLQLAYPVNSARAYISQLAVMARNSLAARQAAKEGPEEAPEAGADEPAELKEPTRPSE